MTYLLTVHHSIFCNCFFSNQCIYFRHFYISIFVHILLDYFMCIFTCAEILFGPQNFIMTCQQVHFECTAQYILAVYMYMYVQYVYIFFYVILIAFYESL